MNNSINIASSNPQKTSETVSSATTNTTQEAASGAETGDLAASAKSFHESIKQAYDESKSNAETENNDKADNEANGNSLPETDDFPEIAATDDRSLLPGGLYLSGQLPVDNKGLVKNEAEQGQSLAADTNIENSLDEELPLLSTLTLVSTSSSIDKNVSADGKLSEISTQLRQLLNAETNADTKKTKPALVRSATGGTETAGKGLENNLVQQTESLTLKPELSGLASDKAAGLLNTPNQQQVLPNVQSSLLLQAATAQGDAGGDTLPLATNVSANNLTTMNSPPTLLQPAISEAFGRPAWSQSMGKQILLMVNQNISTAEIRLNPSNLGPIEVLIDMSDEQVSVSMSSRHAIVRDAMEQALPKLREMLEQSGFSLADADISKHSFAEQREQNAENGRKGIAASKIDLPVISEVSGQVMKQTAVSRSMVDYYI